MSQHRLVALVALCSTALFGCLSWQPRWGAPPPTTPLPGDAAPALAAAEEATAVAHDGEGVQRAMAAYERVLAVDPHHYGALVSLGDLAILRGTAYATSCDEKRALYDRAMMLAERAMYTHPELRRLAHAGARPWEAAHVLEREQMRSMMVWMTALLYRFKECMSSPARVANIRWIQRLDPLLDRMEQLDEGWSGGAVPFTRAFYQFVLPPSMGGDREAAARSFARAIELGPDRLLHRWGRARFFHVLTGNRAGFVEDLEWVVAQDPQESSDRPPWNLYIHRDAQRLLGEADRLFGRS